MTTSRVSRAFGLACVAWTVVACAAQAGAQEAPSVATIDPMIAWAASTLGPLGALTVLGSRALTLMGRCVDVLDRAVVEVGRWRELAPGASLRIEHSHEGLERVRIELTPPEDHDLPTSSTPGRSGRRA